MPDVTRSDSQRSDTSHKPRVSFNRDVHVKRIGREGVVGALAGDGEGHLVPLAVRRERPGRLSRRELEREAEAVLRQVERVNCTPSSFGPEKFNTLPPRPRSKHSGHQPLSSVFNSLDRRGKKKGDDSLRVKRRYSNPDNSSSWSRPVYPPAEEVPGRRKLNRSVSDAGRRDDKKDSKPTSIFGTLDRIRKKKKGPSLAESVQREEVLPPVRKKKQLSPIIELSPKVEAARDGFRFVEPAAGDAGEERVVYAEVVARPSGKTTVHTTVSVDPPSRQHHCTAAATLTGSEEDEGVDMGHRATESRRFSYESDILSPDSTLKKKDNEIREDKIINMLRSRSNPLLDDDLAGGYKREYRTERVIKIGGSEDIDGRGRADGTDFSRRSSKDFVDEVPLKINHYGDSGKFASYDQLDRIKYQEPIRAWTPPLETSLIDSNDLSYRRNRLESRLTNQKRRFISTAQDTKSYRDSGDDLRKEYLTTHINGDKEKGYFEKKIASEIDSHHRQQMLKTKDVFADSGVELSDYRKEPSKDIAALNRKNAETTRVYRTETTRTKSVPVLNKTDYYSDGERRYKGDISSRFIEEERRRREVLPNSTTLVKSYSKSPKEHKITLKKDEKHSSEKKRDKLTKIDKVKQLMFGGKDKSKKKKKQGGEEEEDLLRKRYTEYKGSDVSVNSSPALHRRRQTSSSEVDERTDQELEFYGSRQRLATPSPSLRASETKHEDTWFKSLTRRNKHSKNDKKVKSMNGHSEDSLRSQQSSSKTLRFFGDSDRDSVKSSRLTPLRTRDSSPNTHLLQVPQKRAMRRNFAADSSAESTTEDSNHSQKSIVYLHAATVGDIPGSRKLHRSVISGGRRSMSREELSSNSEAITPQTRTLSRSISVLAPWRPKHNRQEINYDHGGKPPKPPKLRRPTDKTDKTKKSSRDLRSSKENLIDYQESRRGSSESILSDNKRSRGNLVFVGKRENYDEYNRGNRHNGSSTLGRPHQKVDRSQNSERTRDLSRSISIPKDSRVSSGWFKSKQKM